MTRTAMQRLEAIRATRLALASEKSAVAYARKIRKTRRDNADYASKLAHERAMMVQTGGSPYERAVKRIERLTGVPASKWEHDSRHRYTRRAVEAAQILAGIDVDRQPLRAA